MARSFLHACNHLFKRLPAQTVGRQFGDAQLDQGEVNTTTRSGHVTMAELLMGLLTVRSSGAACPAYISTYMVGTLGPVGCAAVSFALGTLGLVACFALISIAVDGADGSDAQFDCVWRLSDLAPNRQSADHLSGQWLASDIIASRSRLSIHGQ